MTPLTLTAPLNFLRAVLPSNRAWAPATTAQAYVQYTNLVRLGRREHYLILVRCEPVEIRIPRIRQ